MSANLVAPTAAWETRMLVPSPMLPLSGVLVEDPDGGWMIDTDLTTPPDGYIVADPDGGVMVDDAAVSGLHTRIVSGVAVVY